MNKDLTFRTAEKHVNNYQKETNDLIAQHREAMECRDCEAFLQLGIDAFHWLMRADLVLRHAARKGGIAYDGDIEIALQQLCKNWLNPCAYAEQWIAVQQERNYQIDNLQEFRNCCEEMKAIVEANDPSENNSLPGAICDLRDVAIQEHLNGQTSEFV